MNRRALLFLALALASLGGPSSAIAQDAGPVVSAQDELFSPPMTHVAPGISLTWRNDGAEQHTITADDGSFDSGPLDPGQSFTLTFVSPGSFQYYCTFHGAPNAQGMAGIVDVS